MRQKIVQKMGASKATGPVLQPDTSAADACPRRHADAARGATPPQVARVLEAIAAVERAVYLHHPYENRERLRGVLPVRIDSLSLDRILGYLERSGKIAVDGGVIRWVSERAGSGPAGAGGAKEGGAQEAGKSILAGTRLEWIEEGKLPDETIGEYIVRVSNAHEPGSYAAEDAKDLDDSMRRAARGESYTHEQVWKEFGL